MYQALMDLEPAALMEILSRLWEIPHGSGNERQISDYVAAFGRRLGLETYQDNNYNVVIRKQATNGYESFPAVILQAHLDMVCEKTAESNHNFLVDPLTICRDGDKLYAEGTTLGADNATGVAFAMCVLADNDLAHPALEAVFTTCEENGLKGIKALDFSRLGGRVIINLDCSDEGIVVGCAGASCVALRLRPTIQPLPKGHVTRTIGIGCLRGGHCGLHAVLGRGNAIVIAGRILTVLEQRFDAQLVAFHSGTQVVSIPREAHFTIAFEAEYQEELEQVLALMETRFQRELQYSDPEICIHVSAAPQAKFCYSAASTKDCITMLNLMPSGVMALHPLVRGLPETSCNIGVAHTDEGEFVVTCSCRSCVAEKKYWLVDKCSKITSLLPHARCTVEADYPEWEHNPDSSIVRLIESVYQERFGSTLLVEHSHGGNECGTFFKELPGADIVCTGTKIHNAHSTDEWVSVQEIQKEWEMLCLTLKAMNR